ncbi:MAG: aminoacetone oxidase family FAD-binding enzyme, partial [Oscillospiraceae bacterium]|nr:aminoacetone oxidase family FAD-binding enzyme [Oscillospiraceae bacterium]
MAQQKEKVTDIAVVGAGASGLAAAIAAKKQNAAASVLLLERNERVGQKLLVTGNGRCNLGNRALCAANYNGSAARYGAVFARFAGVDSFFGEMGLLLRDDEAGRIYPHSNQAASVLDTLRLQCERTGCETRCGFAVQSVRKSGDVWRLTAEDGSAVLARRVILAAGSPAGRGAHNKQLLASLASLGQQILPFTPALAAFTCGDAALRALKGLRVRAEVTLADGDKALAKRTGEVQFGEGYIGGICVMDLCRIAADAQPKRPALLLDLLPQTDAHTLMQLLQGARELRGSLPAAQLTGGMLQKMLGSEIIKRSVADAFKRSCAQLSDDELTRIAGAAKALRFEINGTQGTDKAQVCAGGICGADGETL